MTTWRGGLSVSPSITTVCSSLPMSAMIIAISSSPTSVRASLKWSIMSARDTWDCSSWVCSWMPDVAVPCWPMNAVLTPLTRSIARRLSFISSNCCWFSSKSRLTSKRAPCCAMWVGFSTMSASARAIMRRNWASVMSTAPLVRSVRTAAMPQRSLAMLPFRLSCGKIMSRTSP